MGQDSRVAVRLLSCSVPFGGIVVLFLSAWTWLPASAQDVPHDPSVVRVMVGHAEQVMRGDSNQMKLELSVITPGWGRAYTLNSWMSGRDKTIIRILEPVKQRGEGYLKMKYQLWTYLPKVERTILIPPSSMLQPFLGSDFSYDDLIRASRWDEDYDHHIVGEEEIEGAQAVVIDMNPKPEAPIVYGHIKLWLRKRDSVPLKEEFYDERNVLLKTMCFKEIQSKGGHEIPTHWEMVNHLEEGRRTVVTVLEAQYDLPIDERVFSRRWLKEPLRQ
jgi:hypothetical protein